MEVCQHVKAEKIIKSIRRIVSWDWSTRYRSHDSVLPAPSSGVRCKSTVSGGIRLRLLLTSIGNSLRKRSHALINDCHSACPEASLAWVMIGTVSQMAADCSLWFLNFGNEGMRSRRWCQRRRPWGDDYLKHKPCMRMEYARNTPSPPNTIYWTARKSSLLILVLWVLPGSENGPCPPQFQNINHCHIEPASGQKTSANVLGEGQSIFNAVWEDEIRNVTSSSNNQSGHMRKKALIGSWNLANRDQTSLHMSGVVPETQLWFAEQS